MEFNAAGLISSEAFGLCAGMICAALSAGASKKCGGTAIVLSLAAAAAGAWNEALAYPAAAVMIFLVLTAFRTKPADAAAAAFVSCASAFDIMFFVHGMISPSLEAYSYTLRYDFYYRCVHSPMIIAAVVLVALMLLLIRFFKGAAARAIPVCVISLSLAAAAVMIMHMFMGQLIEYNAGKFNTPLPYSLLAGGVSVLCALLMCIFLRILSARLPMPESLAQTREFYMILAAVILMIVFYCYENTILNNYTSFDAPVYKYTITILIVLMLVTILTALAAVCSYILRTRDRQTQIEHEMKITEMYRKEIKDMQQSIFDFKHDYIKIYSSMSAYIANGEYEKLADFFNTHIAPLQNELFSLEDDTASLRLLKDGAVQGLIYSYIIKARTAGVTLLTDIREQVPPVSVPVIDLNRILGIFLDNAIEQAASNDRTVRFGVIPEDDAVLFVISNTTDNADIERMFRRGETSKGEGRGRGLAIARKLCSSYDELSMHTYLKNGSFICEIYADIG